MNVLFSFCVCVNCEFGQCPAKVGLISMVNQLL